MRECAELEIGLSRRDAGSYAVELRFTQPGSDADVRVGEGEGLACALDLAGLKELLAQPEAYGRALGAGLFAAPKVAETLARAQAAAASQDLPLRVRLAIAVDVAELHGLRWELLRTPDGTLVSAGERILFSRYLASVDWQTVKLRPQASLRALIVIAAPAGLAAYGLAELDVAAELARAQAVLAGIETVALAGPGQATATAIIDALRSGFDVLYVVAHGSWQRGEAFVWLEDAAGAVARIAGATLIARVAELQQRPRLCVLASCESAGAGAGEDPAVLAALGPGLARAGVAAVVAMQGPLSVATAAVLLPRLFAELLQDGQVDRALAVARAAVRERSDWWMPVLFMRLRSGRIWYTPGFGGEGGQFEKWPALLRSIAQGRCTPVLGPALGDALHGSSRELAHRWADEYGYPMAPGGREDLPHVAQYLAVHQDERFPMDKLEGSLRDAVVSRFPQVLTGGAGEGTLDEVLARVADWRLAQGSFDPYQVLARLPCPLYVTTASDGLLAHHLRLAGRSPQVALCPWNPDVVADAAVAEAASVERPAIYHLFGHISAPNSLVITENDIFDFLISVSADREVIPPRVRAALVDSSLLILGFPIDDWKFRVFFRSLMNRAGGGRRKRYTHVAAQIDPEEAQTIDPARTRRYLEEYFEGSDITIYWGSAEDFLRELAGRLPGGRPGA
ncbi:CHAT domain-containing protein [Nannocystis sp.]|uniref:CHAT domain-containing protein n=1 Tax=Nannocystis sp. TaxID=1962667 RepID=UPI002425F3F5|nr:CHAT domain-containing protein [Nannocystis sp.]MBK7826782.1 CHAT domain-containing protein [Nannocystis sp.]MBK9754403.1 CHAT domain-containing protein [Nannocystis sp.]